MRVILYALTAAAVLSGCANKSDTLFGKTVKCQAGQTDCVSAIDDGWQQNGKRDVENNNSPIYGGSGS